ncbi:hypothetical protein HUB94_18850 [Paenibacillus cellulosilyticus]|nr:hypothetical protein HUB94_18850 [Paenibacillus cellulosilyticus]
MMRGLLGDVKSGDSRKVELKAGQVVRGVVMQVDNETKDAIVQINGLQVRAKLETPLSQGQTAMLKVQPESTAETIVLKPVEMAGDQASEDSIRQLVKASGMPEAKWATDLVKDMKRDGIPLTREVVQALKQAVESMPKGTDPEEWMKAAAVALRRGMPVTEQTVAGMRQVMYGKPVDQLLAELETQLADFISADEGEAGTAQQGSKGAVRSQSGGLADTAARLKAILSEMKQSTANLANVEQSDASSEEAAGNVQRWKPEQLGSNAKSFNPVSLQKAAYEAMEMPDDVVEPMTNKGNAAQGQVDNTAARAAVSPSSTAQAATVGGGNESSAWIGKILQLLGVNHEQQLLHETARQLASSVSDNKAAAADAAQSAQETEGTAVQTKQTAAASTVITDHDTQPPTVRPAESSSASIVADRNENEAVDDGEPAKPASDRPVNGQVQAHASTTVQGRPAALLQDIHGSQQLMDDGTPATLQHGIRSADSAVSETLKSALLSLATMDDAPAPLKETAQQLIHQITGQQLMLAPERNGSVLTHVTLFIPIQDENGSQTASVHVQTRRGAKNELDAANCRLLFDLHLKVLGDTVVDVHVVDKIVNLNVWNDHPVMGQIADNERGAVAEALNSAGYQLLTFNVRPTKRDASAGDSVGDLLGGSDLTLPDFPPYGGIPYKGVDLKI